MAVHKTVGYKNIPSKVNGEASFVRIYDIAVDELVDEDQFVLVLFPGVVGEEVYLDIDSLVVTWTDVDTGTLFVWDMGIGEEADGVVDVVLISGSTVGRTAASDFADDQYSATVSPWQIVAGRALILDITTAPTSDGVAGTMTVFFKYRRGIHKRTVSIKP